MRFQGRTSTRRLVVALAASALALSLSAHAAAPNLPDHGRTPGVSDQEITQNNYREMLCADPDGKKHHTTDAKRPSSSYTTALKKKQLSDWGYRDRKVADYEEDHLISLELGGDEASNKNLWPEPYKGKWGAKVKDTMELELGRRICLPDSDADYLSLADARFAVSTDWIAAYKKYVCGRKPALTAKMKAQCKLQ